MSIEFGSLKTCRFSDLKFFKLFSDFEKLEFIKLENSVI